MSIEWTTADHRISIRDGYNVYLSLGRASDPFGVYYIIRPEELPNAQAAAERGCETAKKALLILTLQRMEV